MYSTVFWCLLVVLMFFFWLYCVTTITPFIEQRVCKLLYTVSLGCLWLK